MPWRFLTYHPDCRYTDRLSLNMPCVSVFMWMQPAVSFALSAHTNSQFPLSTGFLQSDQPSIVCKVDIPAALRVNPDLIPVLQWQRTPFPWLDQIYYPSVNIPGGSKPGKRICKGLVSWTRQMNFERNERKGPFGHHQQRFVDAVFCADTMHMAALCVSGIPAIHTRPIGIGRASKRAPLTY